jgi:hypothetical protein
MSIQDKIDHIRQQPEHIRLRWAWGLTAVSMIFIVAIWLYSIRVEVSQMNAPQLTDDQKNILNGFGEQKKSIEDATSQIKGALNNPPASDSNISNTNDNSNTAPDNLMNADNQ